MAASIQIILKLDHVIHKCTLTGKTTSDQSGLGSKVKWGQGIIIVKGYSPLTRFLELESHYLLQLGIIHRGMCRGSSQRVLCG